jgi:hypothetical protein
METFVVRVWRSAGDEHARSPEIDLPLRGLVEHVGSTKPLPFRSGVELLGILESRLADAAPPARSVVRGRAEPPVSRYREAQPP